MWLCHAWMQSTYTILSGSPNEETGAQRQDGEKVSMHHCYLPLNPIIIDDVIGQKTSAIPLPEMSDDLCMVWQVQQGPERQAPQLL